MKHFRPDIRGSRPWVPAELHWRSEICGPNGEEIFMEKWFVFYFSAVNWSEDRLGKKIHQVVES